MYTFDFTDGDNPEAALVQGKDGNLYGTTTSGGTYTNGTVFGIGANGPPTSLYSFGKPTALVLYRLEHKADDVNAWPFSRIFHSDLRRPHIKAQTRPIILAEK